MSSQDPVSRKTTLQDSYTEMSEILMPNDTNNLGRALGGSVLHWMDICGAISARRFSNRQVVTAAMDHVDFMAPIDLGDVVTITGYVFDTGQTSMDIKVDVQAERPTAGETDKAATSFFSFVALDASETPTTVPTLQCPTEAQKELRDIAVEQRQERRQKTRRCLSNTHFQRWVIVCSCFAGNPIYFTPPTNTSLVVLRQSDWENFMWVPLAPDIAAESDSPHIWG